MGQLKVQLVNDFLGPKIVTDPIGLNSLSKKLKRSSEGHGVVFEVMLDLEFIKDGRDYLKYAFENYGGIDADVNVNIYYYNPNTRQWRIWALAKVNFSTYKLTEDRLSVALEQRGIVRRVLNLKDTNVNLETTESEGGVALPANNAIQIPFHSKAILKKFVSGPTNDNEFQQVNAFVITLPPTGTTTNVGIVFYGQIDNVKQTFEELTENFAYPYGWTGYENLAVSDPLGGAGTELNYVAYLSDDSRKSARNPQYVASEAGTLDIAVQLKLKHSIFAENTGGDIDIAGEGCMGNVEVWAWCEKRNSSDEIVFLDKIGEWDMAGVGGNDRIGNFETKNYSKLAEPVSIGDKFYVYLTYHIYGDYDNPEVLGGTGQVHHTFAIEADSEATSISFSSRTVFEETEVDAILLYEAFERCVQYYTNQRFCFYSELLGRIDLGYADDGEASLIAWTNGWRLRNLTDKHIFANLQELLNFVNARFCVGYGFETVDEDGKLIGTGDTGLAPGTQVFRVEKIEHFYNKHSKILSLGTVYDVKKNLKPDMYYNKLIHGYTEKVDVKQENGVDEFNTIRESSIPIVNTKNKLETASDTITGGYQIESQRRLTFLTEDGNLDDKNFAVNVVRDGLNYRSRKGTDGFVVPSFENIYDPETGYNYYLSPGRCRIAWEKFVASCLIRSERKFIKFSSGSGNYQLKSQTTDEVSVVSEDGTSDLSNVEPLWDPEIYILPQSSFTPADMELIEANPFGYVEFTDQFGNVMEGFLFWDNGINVDPNAELADFEFLKVHRQ